MTTEPMDQMAAWRAKAEAAGWIVPPSAAFIRPLAENFPHGSPKETVCMKLARQLLRMDDDFQELKGVSGETLTLAVYRHALNCLFAEMSLTLAETFGLSRMAFPLELGASTPAPVSQEAAAWQAERVEGMRKLMPNNRDGLGPSVAAYILTRQKAPGLYVWGSAAVVRPKLVLEAVGAEMRRIFASAAEKMPASTLGEAVLRDRLKELCSRLPDLFEHAQPGVAVLFRPACGDRAWAMDFMPDDIRMGAPKRRFHTGMRGSGLDKEALWSGLDDIRPIYTAASTALKLYGLAREWKRLAESFPKIWEASCKSDIACVLPEGLRCFSPVNFDEFLRTRMIRGMVEEHGRREHFRRHRVRPDGTRPDGLIPVKATPKVRAHAAHRGDPEYIRAGRAPQKAITEPI